MLHEPALVRAPAMRCAGCTPNGSPCVGCGRAIHAETCRLCPQKLQRVGVSAYHADVNCLPAHVTAPGARS